MIECKRIFFDTAPIIYFLENDDEYYKKVTKIIDTFAGSDFVTSTITVGEYLTGVFRNDDNARVREFKEMIDAYKFHVSDISWDVAETAARIRGKYKAFKMMDSIQLAAAKVEGCDLFVTNDRQLKQFEDVRVLTMEDC